MDLSKVLEKELLEDRFWTHSKTLVEGCTKISTGCMNCWSEAMQMRFNGGKPFDGTITEHPERLLDIMPKSNSRKPRVWTYWNDLFHDGVSDKLRDGLHRMIGHGQDFHIICTKRPQEVVKYWRRTNGAGSLQIRKDRLIYLVTMENQEMIGRRYSYVKDLFDMGWKTGARIEPMLGYVDFSQYENCLNWIICGPENGKGKRPFDQKWAMKLQAQAQAAKVPFFYKAGLLNGKRYIETP